MAIKHQKLSPTLSEEERSGKRRFEGPGKNGHVLKSIFCFASFFLQETLLSPGAQAYEASLLGESRKKSKRGL